MEGAVYNLHGRIFQNKHVTLLYHTPLSYGLPSYAPFRNAVYIGKFTMHLFGHIDTSYLCVCMFTHLRQIYSSGRYLHLRRTLTAGRRKTGGVNTAIHVPQAAQTEVLHRQR